MVSWDGVEFNLYWILEFRGFHFRHDRCTYCWLIGLATANHDYERLVTTSDQAIYHLYQPILILELFWF